MRRLMWLFVFLAAIWGAWWAFATTAMQGAFAGWFEDRVAQGWQADVGEISTHGFPLSLQVRLRDIDVTNPISGLGVSTSQVDLMAAAYWPGYMALELPETPIELKLPTGRLTAKVAQGRAELWLRPNASTQLQHLAASGGALEITSPAGELLLADRLDAAFTQNASVAETYDLHIEIDSLTPGAVLRENLVVPVASPTSFDAFVADLNVTFDQPLSRTSLEGPAPEPRHVAIQQVEIAWGDIHIFADGEVSLDASGIPDGSISLDVAGWRQLVLFGVALGVLAPQEVSAVEILLQASANLDGTPEDLNLTLSFENGEMAMGPIRLGPAPRLFRR